MKQKIPRILIAGTGSNCGKTTLTCGLLSALKKTKIKVAAFKCGPDYIDPMFHKEVLETKSGNLDMYLCGEEMTKYLLAKNSYGLDISIIEGVMGVYDGLSFDNDDYSANYIAKKTDTPIVIVVDVKGKGFSLGAEISGYLKYRDNMIKGVILNNCSKMMYPIYKKMLKEQLDVDCYGYLPYIKGAEIGSRHLGLITSEEISDIKEKMNSLGEVCKESLDIEGLLKLGESVSDLEFENPELINEIEKNNKKHNIDENKIPVAIARDRAFSFYYQDVIDVLEDMGIEFVDFSPIYDKNLPKGVKALILGGGYPELYAKELSNNEEMRNSIKKAVKNGLPTYAECGGFMYLGESITVDGRTYPMVSAIPGNSKMTDKLVRFGYKELMAKSDNMLCQKGGTIRAHEFHYSDTDYYGNGFEAKNKRGRVWDTAFATMTLYAGYPHIHLLGNTDFLKSFVEKIKKNNEEKE